MTEYFPGEELYNYLVNRGPLSENTAKDFFFNLLETLNYMHGMGVIHRDIKAENIIVTGTENRKIKFKLIDFGFSRILENDLTGSFLGTGGYIAPEMRQSIKYSKSVDIWAVGVLLYCSLSCTMPFSISVQSLPRDKGAWECDVFKLSFTKACWYN